MLHIMLEVQAGTKEFVMPSKLKGSYIEKFLLAPQAENKHLFHQGLLLALMGERVSLYSLNRDDKDERWTHEVAKLQNWLSDLAFKEEIKPYHASYHIQSFQQHRKHGVLRHSGYIADKSKLIPLSQDQSKLDPDYSPFVRQGLFDIFQVDIDQFEKHYLNESYLKSHTRLCDCIQTILDKEALFDQGTLHLSAAESLINNLKSIFKIDAIREEDAYTEDTFIYEPTVSFFEDNFIMKSRLNKLAKAKPTDKVTTEQAELKRILHMKALMFGFFTMKYLEMFLVLNPKNSQQPSQFGISVLSMKSKKGFQAFSKWLNQVEEPLTTKRNQDGATEFYKTCFIAPKYNVSTSAPTTNIRYDGLFHLYIKSTAEKEQEIKRRIMHGQNWITKVGKLSLGKLHQPPTIIPNSYWNAIT